MADPFPHLAARAFGVPLAILPGKAETILSAVVLPRLEGRPAAAVGGKPGLPQPGAARAGDIAVIPVAGTLVHRAGAMEAMSGLQGYDGLRSMLREARTDPGVKGILLDLNSPGGECAGLFDLADEVVAASRDKPVYAMVDEMACSAAYLIASAAERVFLTRTAMAGSIGVVAYHLDRSGADARAGLSYTPIYSGARKVDGSSPAPLSDGARSSLQAMVDKTRGMLVDAVAGNRRMRAAAVRDTEAAVYSGADAVRAGLADEVGTVDDAMAALSRRARGGRPAARSPAAATVSSPNMAALAARLYGQPAPAAAARPIDPTAIYASRRAAPPATGDSDGPDSTPPPAGARGASSGWPDPAELYARRNGRSAA